MSYNSSQVIKKGNDILDYIVLFLLLTASGFGYFKYVVSDQVTIIIIFCAIVGIALIKKSFNIEKSFLVYLLVFLFMMLINSVFFDIYRYEVYAGLIARLLIAYFSIYLIGDKFIEIFIKVMYYISLASLAVFVLISAHILPYNMFQGIGFVVPMMFSEVVESKSVLGLIRNSGPFWEPGAFGGFLVMALALNIYMLNTGVTKKSNVIFLIAILSTFSTTAYLATAVVLAFFVFKKFGFNEVTILSSIVIISIASYIFVSSPFVWSKISDQYEYFLDYKNGFNTPWNPQRFVSTYTDYMVFSDNPIFGVGLNNETRFDPKYYVENAISSNGWMNLLTRWGITGFAIYFYYLYKSFGEMAYIYGVEKKVSILLLLVVFILGSSEDYFYLPFFWALTIYSFLIRGDEVRNKNIISI
jgi:hypothetical protein